MSASSIQLIENPKTRKDWENNKLYYRSKSFSKKQLEQVERDNKAIANCIKIMTVRSHGDGGCNAVNGGYCPVIKKKKVFRPVQISTQETIKPTEADEVKTRILTIAETLRDEWEADVEDWTS
jgi:hypothetical protein